MSEPDNGGSSVKPPKEMSMEVRLLLAFLLMGAVMFLSQFLFKNQAPPPQKVGDAKTAVADQAPATPAAPVQADQPTIAQVPPVAPTPSQAQPAFIIDTDLFRIAFSNQGG